MSLILLEELLPFSLENPNHFAEKLNKIFTTHTSEAAWSIISKELLTPDQPFALHLFLFKKIYPNWPKQLDSAPAWFPDTHQKTHLAQWMQEKNLSDIQEFHRWSISHQTEFLSEAIKKIHIHLQKDFLKMCDLSKGAEFPSWLFGAKLNIAESCFTADENRTAILTHTHTGEIKKTSYGALNKLSNRIANGLINRKITPGTAIAIDMPMTLEAVAIYLGIIKVGGIVVSIADSFSKDEIATRLKITQPKLIFTQDTICRNQKKHPLYEKIVAANAPDAIVLAIEENFSPSRAQDTRWQDFLSIEENFIAKACDPMSACNILFSSGTTGTPKAIPWNHTTPIKVAIDAYLHHNIEPNDVLAWPTNLGWMMGPWLIFAGLINQATIALYDDSPRDRGFGEFIQNAKVTMLGVVPTLVACWKQTQCMQRLDWSAIKLFSSTGECSNPEDMLYLMSLAGYKPIIEYCGGTEIGGAYITSTLLEKNYPSVLTTPAMGLDFILLNAEDEPTDLGEVAIIPPVLGLSTTLLNADHHQIYFPHLINGKLLRRHGDQIQRLPSGMYCIFGRVDDTMNLGGIKTSAVEIERALVGIEDIIETAAIATMGHGPSQLIIFAATEKNLDKTFVLAKMQKLINQRLNPLFKIHDVIFVKELPKTASNKIMRRELKKSYLV